MSVPQVNVEKFSGLKKTCGTFELFRSIIAA